jgi:hypothetical protein
MMIVVFGYPFNKARVNIRPSQFGLSICTSGKGDVTREIAAPVAPRRCAVAAPVRYFAGARTHPRTASPRAVSVWHDPG